MSSLTPLTYCPIYAPIVGALGLASAIVFTSFGAAYGTAKAGLGVINISVMRPDQMMRSTLPAIMAGIVALYGVIIGFVILGGMERMKYPLFTGALHLSAGLSVGLAGLASGIAIGIVGDAGVRGVVQQPRLFVGMVLILIFAEVLGLYGMFLALMTCFKATKAVDCS